MKQKRIAKKEYIVWQLPEWQSLFSHTFLCRRKKIDFLLSLSLFFFSHTTTITTASAVEFRSNWVPGVLVQASRFLVWENPDFRFTSILLDESQRTRRQMCPLASLPLTFSSQSFAVSIATHILGNLFRAFFGSGLVWSGTVSGYLVYVFLFLSLFVSLRSFVPFVCLLACVCVCEYFVCVNSVSAYMYFEFSFSLNNFLFENFDIFNQKNDSVCGCVCV